MHTPVIFLNNRKKRRGDLTYGSRYELNIKRIWGCARFTYRIPSEENFVYGVPRICPKLEGIQKAPMTSHALLNVKK